MEAIPVETPDHLDDFTRAYLECAAWTSTEGENGEIQIDDLMNDGKAEWSEQAIAAAVADCKDFQVDNRGLLDAVSETFGATDAQHGHDFWLTRNGHGAGFWDRGYGASGNVLSEAAKVYGEAWLYLGDDGKVYFT